MDISALGEFELISRLTAHLTTRADIALGIGDDCAVLDIGADQLLLATCDSQVEGVHFTLQTSHPAQIGRKALAVNLSDIAAMGGEPRYALVSLILPPHLPLDVLDDLYVGLREEAMEYATALVGGNIAGTGSSEKLIIDITLLGTIARGCALTRGGARVGDVLCVTGGLGDAAAGLYTLLHEQEQYEAQGVEFVRVAQRTPRPRIPEGRVLSQLGPEVVTALLDVSDGLSGDLGHLCTRSNVGARIDVASLPLSDAMRMVANRAGLDPLHWALHGGEDYELLFTVAPEHVQTVINAVREATGTPVTVIGTALPVTEGMKLHYADGREELLSVKSWDHLRQ